MDLLKGLNERQKTAVEYTEGPLLVVAGAGAGKTKVITHRIAYLIQKGVLPEQILAVTFTNKAANEMKERIKKLLDSETGIRTSSTSPTIGTFHSVSSRILRENAKKTGRTANFSILDQEDSLKIIKNSLKTLNINPKQFQPPKVQAIISRQKSDLVNLSEYAAEAENNFFPRTIALIWEEYEKSLLQQNSFDFDDLISETVKLFEKNPEILAHYQNKWMYILVDEYQDTNRAQYILTKLLAQKTKNICVVGDEDQSIYSWRGADFRNVFKFEKDWPNTKIVMLEENYRSVKKILEAANAVIAKNKVRKPKNLFSSMEEGAKIGLFQALNEMEEAKFIAVKTFELLEKGIIPTDIAILYRANFQSRALEELFLSLNIPYQVIGTRFFERKEVKDILAYLKASLNKQDIISLERIINEPPRGVGKAALLNYISGKKLPQEKGEKMENFIKLLDAIKDTVYQMPLSKALAEIIKKTGYEDYLNDGTEEGANRLENLKELIALSAKYDAEPPETGIIKFLEDITLMSDQDSLGKTASGNKKEQNTVRFMTVHAAKGLEFKNIFISGMEEGLFPYGNNGGPANEEEERRLFYVALTRAKEKIILSFALNRSFFGGRQINRPSRFVFEIPEELLEESWPEPDIVKTIKYE